MTMTISNSCARLKSNRFWRIVTLTAFMWVSVVGNAQDKDVYQKIDSLIVYLSSLDASEEKADVLLEISKIYGNIDCAGGIEYSQLSLALSQKINYPKGIQKASKRMGFVFITCEMNVAEAIPYYETSLKYAIELGDLEGEMESTRDIAYCKYVLEEFEAALDFYFKALDIAKKIQGQRIRIGLIRLYREYIRRNRRHIIRKKIPKAHS